MAKKSSKDKAMSGMANQVPIGIMDKPPTTAKEAAKKQNSISFSVRLERKMVDGKEVVHGSVDSYDLAHKELKEEYADMVKLKDRVDKMVNEFIGAFGKKAETEEE